MPQVSPTRTNCVSGFTPTIERSFATTLRVATGEVPGRTGPSPSQELEKSDPPLTFVLPLALVVVVDENSPEVDPFGDIFHVDVCSRDLHLIQIGGAGTTDWD